MPFKKILSRITQESPGLCGAILIDVQGEAVDMAGTLSPYHLSAAGAHHGILSRNIGEMIRRFAGTEIEEIQVLTDQWLTLVLRVDSDYFLVCLFEEGQSRPGKFLYEARQSVRALKEEMY